MLKAASVEKVTVEQLITQLDDTTFIPEQQPYHSLLQMYNFKIQLGQILFPTELGYRMGFFQRLPVSWIRFIYAGCIRFGNLPDFNVTKLLLDSAHDAMPLYEYCKRENIVPFFDSNEKRGIKVRYKNDFTIGKDGVSVCNEGRRMSHDSCEPSKHKLTFRHRSTKMWYCRLYHIMMLQHLDAWDLPNESALRKLILKTT